jgi:hypothetical protein
VSVNRLVLEHELRWAKSLQQQYWETKKSDESTPFPFILPCLFFSSSTSVHQLPFNLGLCHGNNDSGITIIDITHPEIFKYGFVDLESTYPTNWRPSVRPVGPLDAETYLGKFRKVEEDPYEKADVDYVRRLENSMIVEVGSLRSTGPSGKWKNVQDGAESLFRW